MHTQCNLPTYTCLHFYNPSHTVRTSHQTILLHSLPSRAIASLIWAWIQPKDMPDEFVSSVFPAAAPSWGLVPHAGATSFRTSMPMELSRLSNGLRGKALIHAPATGRITEYARSGALLQGQRGNQTGRIGSRMCCIGDFICVFQFNLFPPRLHIQSDSFMRPNYLYHVIAE